MTATVVRWVAWVLALPGEAVMVLAIDLESERLALLSARLRYPSLHLYRLAIYFRTPSGVRGSAP